MRFFSPAEFYCRCGRSECDASKEIVPALAQTLDSQRTIASRPIVITSGLRCAYWNEHEGGKPDSEHLTGEAADLACSTSSERAELLRWIYRYDLFRRVGIGKTFLHVGVSERVPDAAWLY